MKIVQSEWDKSDEAWVDENKVIVDVNPKTFAFQLNSDKESQAQN